MSSLVELVDIMLSITDVSFSVCEFIIGIFFLSKVNLSC